MNTRRNIFSEYERAAGQAGLIVPYLPGWSHTAATPTNSRCYIARFQADRARTITKIAFIVSTAAGSDDAVDAGLLDESYTPLVTSGSTTGKLNATGVQTVSFTAYTPEPGRIYHAALAMPASWGGTAPQIIMMNGVSNSGDLFGTTAGVRETAAQTPKFPIGSTILSPVGTPTVPLMAVRES